MSRWAAVDDLPISFQEVAYDLGEIYCRISMVVGDSPDPQPDYNLFGQIPDLEERLTANMNALNDLAARLEDMAGIRGGRPDHPAQYGGTIQRMLNYSWQAQKYKKRLLWPVQRRQRLSERDEEHAARSR